MKLAALGEDRLLTELLSKLGRGKDIILGAGDDCAIVSVPKKRLAVLKTDCVVETVHFEKGANPYSVGWKAMMRPLSDFAAMAALPRFALVTLVARGSTDINWLQKVYRGLAAAARRFDIAIVGGETSRTPGPITLSISVVGFVERRAWVSRSGGKAGDAIFVTGRLGGSLRGRHLTFIPRIDEARWLTANFRIHAMMDLSDGLGADLPRLALASGVSFEVDPALVPKNRGSSAREAISDGEDYELLFTLSQPETERLMRDWRRRFPRVPLTCVGRLERKSNRSQKRLPRGYIHFQ